MDIKNPVLKKIWEDRYRKNGESISDNLRRVAKYCAKNPDEEVAFYNLMDKGHFIVGGRTMSNAGIGRDLTLNNCFVAPQVKDDLTDIFQKVGLGARTHQRGGGIGYCFSQLRPKGSPTSNDAIASGAVSFMDVFNAQTSTILQGNRRGANMGVMNIYSMDIEEFITAKSTDEKRLNHFNLSVMVDDDFMEAVEYDMDIDLHFPVYAEDGSILKDPLQWKYSKKVNARYLWDLIMRKAYDNGEPGIFFYDNMNKDNNLWYIERIVCSNPCAEYLAGTIYGKNPKTGEMLDPSKFGGACNLGSLLLHNFIVNPFKKGAKVDYKKLAEAIHNAIRLLDNIIDINNFPDQIYRNYQEAFRTIGLGVTGLANAIVMLGYTYGSADALVVTDQLMNFIALEAYKASIELAKEKGEFPFLDREKFVQSGFLTKHAELYPEWKEVISDILTYGIRNAKILSIAPVGTGSLTWGNNCSSGLEPIFSLQYDRKVKMGGQSEDDVQIVTIRDYAYEKWLEVKNDSACVVDESTFVTAMNLTVKEHLDMLSTIAFHIDMSCSKTINVPTEYSFEDTKEVYKYCHKYGIKGCTIFRPNEIRQGILIAEPKKETVEEPVAEEVALERGFILEASDDLMGKKTKVMTGCGGLHIQAWFDPETGDMMELFLSKGSQGGCNSYMIGLSRVISTALRGGVPIEALCDQLDSVPACSSYAVRTATKKDTSKGSNCPMAIGKIIMGMQRQAWDEVGIFEDKRPTKVQKKSVPNIAKEVEKLVKPSKNSCPECGESVENIGGCIQCSGCGWSKCG